MISLQELEERIEEESVDLPIPRSRQKESKVKLSREPRSRREEVLEEFDRKILWEMKSIVRDRRAYYALANDVWRIKGETTFVSTLRQIEKNHKLFPRYVIAVLNKILK